MQGLYYERKLDARKTPEDNIMEPNEYLDAAKQRRGLKSDYELAQELETTTGCISNYRNGRSIPDTYTMARLAKMIEGDPMTAIAAAEAKRAKSDKARKFWKAWLSTAALLAIMPAVHAIEKISLLYIMLNRRHAAKTM